MAKLQVNIRNKLDIKNFNQSKERNKEILFAIDNTRLFIQSIKQISTKKPASIEELNKDYDALTNIF